MKDTTATSRRKGGPACSVCTHPRREEFDRALMMETMSSAAVAREIGCHRSSVSRHVRNHLLPTIKDKARADSELGDIDIFGELKALYRRMKEHLARAERADNWQAIRAFHAEARHDLDFLARLLGELDDRPQINVLLSPQWVEVRTVLLTALAPFPDARVAAAGALLEVEHDERGE